MVKSDKDVLTERFVLILKKLETIEKKMVKIEKFCNDANIKADKMQASVRGIVDKVC